MADIDLCPLDDFSPPGPLAGEMLLPPGFIAPALRGNPAFPTKAEPDAYLVLQDCSDLVQATLRHLDVANPGKVTCVVPVELIWGRATTAHGRTRAQRATGPGAVVVRTPEGAEWRQYVGFQVTLSRPVFEQVAVTDRVDTIIHEACHVAGFARGQNEGHGPAWMVKMIVCGVKPQQYGEAVTALLASIECSACGWQNGTMRPATAAAFQLGTTFICPQCKTRLNKEDVAIPEAAERQVASQVKRILSRGDRGYCCVKCGTGFVLPAKFVERVKDAAVFGAARAHGLPRCGECHEAMSLAGVIPAPGRAPRFGDLPEPPG